MIYSMNALSQPDSESNLKTFITCDSKMLDDAFGETQGQLQEQYSTLKQMTNLLLQYEQQCVDKFDIANAKETRIRINLMRLKEEELLRRIAEQKHQQETLTVRQESQSELQSFDSRWSKVINSTLLDCTEAENRLKVDHKVEREQLTQKYELQKSNFRPSIKLDSIKKKVNGLIKLHLYDEAEVLLKDANELQESEVKAWQQKIQSKKGQALILLGKKQAKQFQTLRCKNQNLLTKKMKQRDRAFDIIVKKYQIRQDELKKAVHKNVRTINHSLLSTRRLR